MAPSTIAARMRVRRDMKVMGEWEPGLELVVVFWRASFDPVFTGILGDVERLISVLEHLPPVGIKSRGG